MVSVVSTLTSWISYPLSMAFAISFKYHTLNLLFKNDFAAPLIAKSNDWNTWVRFTGTNTVTMVFIDQMKNALGALSLKSIKNEHAFCSSRSKLALFDFANGKIIDSRCSMNLSSLLQWFFVWVKLNPSGNWIPVRWQRLVLPW